MDRIAPMIESFQVLLGPDSPPINAKVPWVIKLRDMNGKYSEDAEGHRSISVPNTEEGRLLFETIVRTYPPDSADLVLIPRVMPQGIVTVPFIRGGRLPTSRLDAILERCMIDHLKEYPIFQDINNLYNEINELDLSVQAAALGFLIAESERLLQKVILEAENHP